MASRPNGPRRRRKRPAPPETPDSGRSLFGRTDVLIALLLGAGVVLIAVVAVVISNRSSSSPSASEQNTPAAVPTSPPAPFSPVTDDDRAIQELARRSIEVLPEGQWPSLYDSFTADFQQRCPRDEFVQGGVDASQNLGSDLSLLRFKRLESVNITADSATAVVVGELQGQSEYSVQASFRKLDGAWRIAPADNTSGCLAFQRLSG